VSDIPIKTGTLAKAINGVPFFMVLLYFGNGLINIKASLRPKYLFVDTKGRSTFVNQKQPKSKTTNNPKKYKYQALNLLIKARVINQFFLFQRAKITMWVKTVAK
jgi:hypothetical protein